VGTKSHPQYLSSNDVLGPAWHGSRVLRNKATNEGKTWAPDPEAGAHVFGAIKRLAISQKQLQYKASAQNWFYEKLRPDTTI